MFDSDHDWLDDFTNDLDPLHIYDLNGDGYTSFDEEYLLTHDHDEDSPNVSSDDDYDEFSDELDEYDRDEYDMDDPDDDDFDEQDDEFDEYGERDSCDDESTASMESLDEITASQKTEKLLYAKVKLGDSSFGYSYCCNDQSIKAGDKVIVPVGDKQEITGTVISVDLYARDQVPYPIEKTKFIIRKAEEADTQIDTTVGYSTLATVLQKVADTRANAMKSTDSIPSHSTNNTTQRYIPVKPSFSADITSSQTVKLSEKGNFFVSWFAFCVVCFLPFVFIAIVLDVIFFDPSATAGIHALVAFISCLACGFGYALHDRAKAKKDPEATQNARYLCIVIAVICVIISIAIMGTSSANEKERQIEEWNKLFSNSRSYSTTVKYDTSSSSNSKNTSSNKSTTYRKSSSSKSSSDPYNAKDYAHPDDFYYDHYDDFVDFEEAEDYWDSYN